MLTQLTHYLQGITQLILPLQCRGCGSDLVSEGAQLCALCTIALPETQYTPYPNNPVEKMFVGRVPIHAATSMYYFNKNSLLQHLLHQLKYGGNQAIGVELGTMLGTRLLVSHRYTQVDYIIPIPLSKKRQQQRGYNQSLAISNGIAASMQVPVLDNLAIRQRDNETQTHKTRQERWENMQNVFYSNNTNIIAHKHILLVDDVLTTGATLEACAQALLQQCNCTISIATVAMASYL